MNLGDHVSFGFSQWNDALSWALALAVVAKVASTLAMLVHGRERSLRWLAGREAVGWWTTKASALAACACAALLCRRAGDVVGQAVFGALLVLGVAWVWRRVRRGAVVPA